MTITIVFDPPIITDTPAVFNSKAFSTVGQWNAWTTEANALAVDVNAKQTTASAAAATATAQADISTTNANTTINQAGIATTAASTATTAAATATAAAATATAASATAVAAAASINRDGSGGVAGLTLYKINMKSSGAGTYTSFMTNSNTASRTYTFQDADGTVAFTGDTASKATNIAGGLGGQLVYQSALDTTGLLTNGTVGSILRAGGGTAAPSWSAPTFPNIATANKILIGDGTNIVLSTPSYPNASATTGKIIVSDGTNWIASTPTFPNTSSTIGKMIVSDGTNWIASTPTFPNASATTGKIIKSDGTNWISSTETWLAGGNVTFSGAYTFVGTLTNNTSITFPTTGTLAILAANTFTAAQRGIVVNLTDASTVSLDLSLANQFNLTTTSAVGATRTLGTPTNVVSGQQGIINIYQDTSGSRALVTDWIYAWAGGSSVSLSTPGCTRDLLAYSVDSYVTGTVTMTIATPGVATLTSHGLLNGNKVRMTTTGALPTGLAASTSYWVHVIDANTFHFCTSLANVAAGTYIATTGSQSGTHTLVGGAITLNLTLAVA